MKQDRKLHPCAANGSCSWFPWWQHKQKEIREFCGVFETMFKFAVRSSSPIRSIGFQGCLFFDHPLVKRRAAKRDVVPGPELCSSYRGHKLHAYSEDRGLSHTNSVSAAA
ncbi:hypothetical protein VFPPC_16698 [Pochonia chlamydosporia 170]|uniref:Uncharacterized protein n=1 Tax=Pochonia chlamydosporia 170 TaxID=1380566 RepID=A0A179F7L2_METCM|nr:hypothetical protein VFPPC_16698 [Pochonia chlamydosporia 170]OAQ61089.1 hypothetical protein VFPPC_16698 [Pochonia chlamydosporia 170]